MKRSTMILGWLALATFGRGPSDAAEFKVEGRTFVLPDGFTIEQIAGPPLVDRPIVADFDGRGRLYVADSSGSNDPVRKQLDEKPHRIVRLEDTDGDGRFDRRTIFADRMMFPEGAMWLDGSLYVAAPPVIWKLTDEDDDGIADHRAVWFDGKTLTGCANDLHGPYRGPDGWIYWCKGAFARQTYERPGKAPFVTRAAHIFRARPDGSGIEPVMTGGMDNPVDVAFTPGGERIFTTTFLQHPGNGRRDGLIHAIYGGVYGKVHDVIDGHPRTSPDVMPVLTHLGPAAPCGLTRYESNVFGSSYGDDNVPTVFACLFNLHKVTRHDLKPDGASFVSTDTDFLTAPDLDFHPTDIHEDADGSLVVLDTGGWYKLCCPTSQLVKPDVLGGIYRVRREGAPKIDDPRGLKLAWDELQFEDLSKLLDDSRPTVRARAIQAIARLGGKVAPKLHAISRSSTARRNAIWALTRIDDPRARTVVRAGLFSDDANVRQAALHSIALWRDRDALGAVLDVLRLRNPWVASARKDLVLQNQRAAAEALGRIGDRAAVPELLQAASDVSDVGDRALEHSITYALIEIADPDSTRAGLSSHDPKIRRAALIALDQMDGGGLGAKDVAPSLASNDPALRSAASWIAGHHPDWGDALAGSLRHRLGARDLPDIARNQLTDQLASFAHSKPVATLLADRVRDPNAPPRQRLTALGAMARSGLKDVPAPWIESLTQPLASDDPELIRAAVATARAIPIAQEAAGDLRAALLKIAANQDQPAEVRLDALAAIPGGPGAIDPEIFGFLRTRLDPERPASSRLLAADVLARTRLERDQLNALLEDLKAVGPLEVDRLLAVFEQSTDPALGRAIIAALKESPSLAGLRPEALKPRLDRFGPEVRKEAEALYATLVGDAAAQSARLEELLPTLKGGDVRRGQAIFNGPKATCISCHAVGYLGGKIGPDLTKIGSIRSERDLLEAIAFPSASFVRSYEPVIVATRDGRLVSGLVRLDSGDEIVLTTAADQEAHIPRDQVEEVRPGNVSIMPAGLDRQLTGQELADLIAFLKACK